MNGFAATDIEGARYVAIHYSADEEKDTAWAVRTSNGVPIDEWQREMELNESIYDGMAVYADYRDHVHCPPVIREKDIPIVPQSIYIGGWDCGQTLQPAFVLLQVTPRPFQVHALLEIVWPGAPMEKFAPLVLDRLMQWHPALWAEVDHYGDATVTTKSGSRGESARDVAKAKGISITPVSNQWAGRFSAVTWLLTTMIDEETPKFFLSGKGCPTLRQGFQGAYHWKISTSGDPSGPGMELREPSKNAWSHTHDALQYAAVAVKKLIDKKATTGSKSRR